MHPPAGWVSRTRRPFEILTCLARQLAIWPRRRRAAGRSKIRTGEITVALVCAVVLAASRVVPFHAEPSSRCAGHLADIANGAQSAVIGEPLARLKCLGHGR